MKRYMLFQVIPVPLACRCDEKFLRRFCSSRKHRNLVCPDMTGNAGFHHLMQMAEKTKARHIRTCVNLILPRRLRGVFIQCHHRLHRFLEPFRIFFSHPVCRAENAGAKRFRQNQQVAHTACIVLPDSVRMYRSGYGKTVFYAVIRDRMPSRERAARLLYLFCTAAHNFTQKIQIHLLRKTDDIECCPHLAAHCINIT